MKITKELSSYIASKLLEPKWELLKKEEQTFKDGLEKSVSKMIPAEIMLYYKAYPDYFRNISIYCQDNNNSNPTSYSFNLPSFSYRTIYLKALECSNVKELCDMYDLYCKNKNLINSKYKELNTLVNSYGTVARLKENFIEAFNCIPKDLLEKKTGVLVRNIDGIKNWLNSNQI